MRYSAPNLNNDLVLAIASLAAVPALFISKNRVSFDWRGTDHLDTENGVTMNDIVMKMLDTNTTRYIPQSMIDAPLTVKGSTIYWKDQPVIYVTLPREEGQVIRLDVIEGEMANEILCNGIDAMRTANQLAAAVKQEILALEDGKIVFKTKVLDLAKLANHETAARHVMDLIKLGEESQLEASLAQLIYRNRITYKDGTLVAGKFEFTYTAGLLQALAVYHSNRPCLFNGL